MPELPLLELLELPLLELLAQYTVTEVPDASDAPADGLWLVTTSVSLAQLLSAVGE